MMNKIFATAVLLLCLNVDISAQELLNPNNSTEYLCVPLEMISDFDNSNEFTPENCEFLKEGNFLSAKSEIVKKGLDNSSCIELTNSDLPDAGGTYFVKCNKEISLENKEGVGAWFKSNKSLAVDFYFEDASGKIFYVPKKFIKGMSAWSFSYSTTESYRISINQRKINETIIYPCKFLGFYFYPREENTVVYMDDVKKVKELNKDLAPSFSVNPQKIANVYQLNEPVNTEITSVGNKLKLLIRNYQGEIVSEKLADKTTSLKLPTDTQGYYELIILSYQDKISDENLLNGKMFSFSVLRDETVFNDKLGICTHPQRASCSPRSVDLMSILGARYVRFGMVQEFLENKKGEYQFRDNTIEILNKARDKGLKFVTIFRDKTPPLTEELSDKFLNFSRFLLDNYRGVIDKVELWNEWSNGTGTHPQYKDQQTADNYTKFLKSTYSVLKSEYPEVEIIGLGGENPQRFKAHIKEMFEAGAGEYMDAISLHPYRQPVAPESRIEKVHHMSMAEQVQDIVEISKKHNGPDKVYVTEIGYSTHMLNWGVNDYTQAEYVVKTLGILLASNVVEQVDWYNLYNMLDYTGTRTYPKIEEYSQYHFCLFNGEKYNFAVKPGAMAFRFFAKICDGFISGKQIENENGVTCLSMNLKDNRKLDIVWNTQKESTYKVEGDSVVYDLMGNVVENKGIINLSQVPVYILKKND